jgi:hypothetical protein
VKEVEVSVAERKIWFRRGPRGSRGSRGSLEIGLVVLVCALVAGAVVGTGLARTVLETPDPLAWLRNDRGQVVQVNPETGSPVEKLQVGAPGDPLSVTQGDGVLVVTNLRTNEVTVFDLSLLRVAGVRPAGQGALKVLLSKRQIYVVNKEAGEIILLDPLTAAPVAEPWRLDAPLADAALDATGAIWALGRTGRLVTLLWSDASRGFVERERRELAGVGGDAVLVAHEQGVTAVDPAGPVRQVGTGRDRSLQANGLAGRLAAADVSPAALVPVSSPGSASILLVGPDRAVAVDAGRLGCGKPGKPAVYRDMVYVSCTGDRKVIVLDAAGRRAGTDITTARDPELVLHAGLLIVNVPGAPNGFVVKPDGTTQQIQTDDPRVPVHDPDSQPTALPPGLGLRPTKPRPPTNQQGQNPNGGSPRQSEGSRPGTPPPSSTGTTSGGPTANPATGTPGPTPGGGTPGPTTPGSPVPTTPDPGPSTPDPGPTTPDPVPTTPDPVPTTPDPVPTTPDPGPTTPDPADLTPTGAIAEARTDSSVQVSWAPPRIPPTDYRILRAETGEQLATTGGGATSSIVTGLALGQPVSFVVEAVSAAGSFRSAPSNAVVAFGRPGSPNIGIELVTRSPTAITLRVSVDVVTDGGSPVTSYDLSVSTGAGRNLLTVQGVPIGQRPYQFVATCSEPGDICLSGGGLNAAATLVNAAGAGPPATTAFSVPEPPAFAFGQPFMMVSAGGKCMDADLRLHVCGGSAGQMWIHNNGGAITNQSNGWCLAANDTLHLARDGCSERPKRWSRVNAVGNTAMIQNQDSGRECVYVAGDVAGEGVQVLDREGCGNSAQERWTAYRQQAGVPMTAATPAALTGPIGGGAKDGPLGAPAIALLLLPLAVGLVRRRGRVRRVR